MVPLVLLDRRMQATGGPGIIPFELAGPERSVEILRRWGADGQRAARASLLLDFPYMVGYTTLHLRITRRLGATRPARRAVAAIQIAAGACDAVENAALLGVVARNGDARLASLARRAARAKFAGLIVGWVYGGVSFARAPHLGG
jgi:hypothetical protein